MSIVGKAIRVVCLLSVGALSACAASHDPSGAEATAAVSAAKQGSEGWRDVDTIALDTGVTLTYVAQGRPSGEVVIFLHGYTDSHRSYDRVLPIFPRRYRAYALDQRGHGDSDKPACCYRQGDFVADVIAFMDALGIAEATLVGHSMGSFIAHQAAVEHPDRVSRLVLIGSAPTSAGNPVLVDFLDFVGTLTDPIDPEFIREFQASTAFEPLPPWFLDVVVSESQKVPATVWQQALAGLVAEDHSASLPNISAPTLILWGDKDDIFPAADQQALQAALPGATFITYADVGHGTHWEVPARVTVDIARFLRER
ncbi:alpha/beta fold hydrolase [Haliangium sp.]|uniref:alpha/beta fold hydrolase n=1 Tax=Haliangium sp. TaxID=2663208 RepID=UPI003D128A8B